MRVHALVAASLLATVTATVAGATPPTTTDKMVNQFTYKTNPSGHWFYLSSLRALGTGYSGKTGNACFLGPVQCWDDAAGGGPGSAVAVNRGTTALTYQTVTLPPHYVVAATDGADGASGVAWLATETGSYDIVVTFLGIDSAEAGHSVGIYSNHGGMSVIGPYVIASAAQKVILRQTVDLNSGEFIYIVNTNASGTAGTFTYVAMRAQVTPHAGGCAAGAC